MWIRVSGLFWLVSVNLCLHTINRSNWSRLLLGGIYKQFQLIPYAVLGLRNNDKFFLFKHEDGYSGLDYLWLVKIYLHSKCFFFIYNVRSIFYVRNVKVPKKMLQVYQYVYNRINLYSIIYRQFSLFSLSFSLSNFLYNMSTVFKFDPFHSYC